jgi:hypothetical protein
VQRAADARTRARLSLDPVTLTFTTPAAQTFTASLRFEATLKAVSSNVAVATVSPAVAEACKPEQRDSTRDGKRDGCGDGEARGDSRVVAVDGRMRGAVYSATFTVTPVASGNATITVTDDEGDTATVAVTVVGNKEKIYVTNQGAFPSGSVTVFDAGANGNVAPSATISGTNTGLNHPVGIAVDGAGQIYVANKNNSVTVYASGANGNVAPTATISGSSTMLNGPNGVAVDGSANAYVVEGGGCCFVLRYPAGSTGNVAPAAVIAGSNTQLNAPYGIAIDRTGRIYVSNQGVSGASKGEGSVTIFAAGANGDVAPIATIGRAFISGTPVVDNNRGLSGVAVDGQGNIYVANFATGLAFGVLSTDSVAVYPPGTNGNSVAPTSTIGGPNSGLGGPTGVAVDSAGKIYVANTGLASITVYAAGANGDVAPIATISGSNTGLGSPTPPNFGDGKFLTVR